MADAEKSSAGPAELDPDARLRFVRWLVATGRLSEWVDVPQARGVAREHDIAKATAWRVPKSPAPSGERADGL